MGRRTAVFGVGRRAPRYPRPKSIADECVWNGTDLKVKAGLKNMADALWATGG